MRKSSRTDHNYLGWPGWVPFGASPVTTEQRSVGHGQGSLRQLSARQHGPAGALGPRPGGAAQGGRGLPERRRWDLIAEFVEVELGRHRRVIVWKLSALSNYSCSKFALK